jgi:hypothetical protein
VSDGRRSRSDDWSSVPAHDPAHATQGTAGLEAHRTADTSAAGHAGGRVHGRPAPQYGEYAPEGWVNPVLVEQERRERAERAHESDRPVAARPVASRSSEERRDAAPDASPTPVAGRWGASPFDFVVTVALLVTGLTSTLQSLQVRSVASTVRQGLESRGFDVADPAALSTAAVVVALVGLVVFVGVVWWSVRRLRAKRLTFWVPLLGGLVMGVLSLVVFVVAMLQGQDLR